MKEKIYELLKVFCGGFAALLLVSLGLFWGRFFCDTFLLKNMARESEWTNIKISPSGLLPAEIENEPNVARHSEFRGYIELETPTIRRLGLVNYIEQMESQRTDNFDKSSGLFVLSFTIRMKPEDKKEKVTLFAGPEGVAEEPVKELGSFAEPLYTDLDYPTTVTYDKKLRRFYNINFKERKVTKGPEIEEGSDLQPIQIGRPGKGREDFLRLWWAAPEREVKQEDKDTEEGIKRYWTKYERILIPSYPPGGRYATVLDKSGRIFLVERENLEIAGFAGYLPAPISLFGADKTARPEDLLGFVCAPVALRPDDEYLGMGAAALSREGTSMAVAVFDKEGKLIQQRNSGAGQYYHRDFDGDGVYERRWYDVETDSNKLFFWGKPWSPFVTVLRYLLENVQAPSLSIATFFTSDIFEASSGHRALFLLPNSFIGMKGRQSGVNLMWKFFGGLLLILPSTILSVLLAWSVKKDALKTGLSKNERLWWIAGVLCFGIAGYVSYRLCRPAAGLVSCRNCGKSRRVDMEICHRCGSGWVVPELQDPGWRVRN